MGKVGRGRHSARVRGRSKGVSRIGDAPCDHRSLAFWEGRLGALSLARRSSPRGKRCRTMRSELVRLASERGLAASGSGHRRTNDLAGVARSRAGNSRAATGFPPRALRSTIAVAPEAAASTRSHRCREGQAPTRVPRRCARGRQRWREGDREPTTWDRTRRSAAQNRPGLLRSTPMRAAAPH